MEVIAVELEADDTRFALVYKKVNALSRMQKERIKRTYAKFFPGQEIIMMYAEADKLPHYYGKEDLIEWLVTNNHRSEFKKYTF
ncbi:hypothetical protein [Flavobacterium pallidum]|uniref:Uncharacterized protein n=1 Tax=Flavobacterium pallidum TaxID=2172098 RepID=A0A2S1SHR6_9FLAO|nr:hypothetical protein [Flavobacterium pallidum]AWI25956.1 hypothetical protein HYN49_08615 [Flavobacterium pallidum]